MCQIRLRTKRIFRISHIFKISRIIPFCNLLIVSLPEQDGSLLRCQRISRHLIGYNCFLVKRQDCGRLWMAETAESWMHKLR